MTRKDYQLIANVFNDLAQVIELKGTVAENLIKMLADDLQADNPRFDRARFIKACGLVEVI
jgi:hypothetical protein